MSQVTSDCAVDAEARDTSTDEPTPSPKIGLALSGGGFRASLFHLGVIRRLEELGIMKHVHTISGVSGGSIIAAYYVIEMEKRLRGRRHEFASDPSRLDEVRLRVFRDIAGCFFQALDQNLRSRAMVFSPFYHPLLWVKSLWPTLSRSDIMQSEFDRWLYHHESLDHLPAVTRSATQGASHVANSTPDVLGPNVILNATSLLTGERREFTRESVSGLREGLSRSLLNFGSGDPSSRLRVVHVTPRQQSPYWAGPGRPEH